MATVHWTNKSGGSWQTGSNWSTGSVPASTDDVIIDAVGTYTVTTSAAVTVNSLQTIATVTLDITGTTFAMTNGTGGGANAGTIIDDNSSTLFLGGSIDNSGTIREDSTANTTDMRLTSATVSLSGHGHVTLSDSANNRIYGNAAADTLVNVDNTISGAGQLGAGQLTLVNQSGGIIDATGTTNALLLNVGPGSVTNSGLLEDTGTGGLIIQNTTVNDTSGGTIAAIGSGAIVELAGGTIQGGTLLTSGGGVIESVGGNAGLDGTIAAVNNKGTFTVSNGTILYLAGTINNTGKITENSGGNTTDIRLSYPVVTLTGGGTISMSNNINNRIYGNGPGYQLINVDNTISGAGQVGAATMTLINQTKGVINANQTTQLILNSPNIVTNAGLLEATSTGGLFIQNTTVNNTGGTVEAVGSGSHVDLGGGTIQGGTVMSASGGVIQTVGGNGALDGSTFGSITLMGKLNVTNGTNLYLAGTINNKGTIADQSTVNTTQIILSSNTTLTGAGTITLSNSDTNRIYGNTTTTELINVNNVIQGTGQLGSAQMTLINEASGVINANNAPIANLSSGVLVLNCNGGVFNSGLIEDTGTAGLTILNTGVDNLGGTITAAGSGTHVDLSGSVIVGGLLTTSGGGVINDVSASTLDGSESGIGAVTNAGSLNVLNGVYMNLDGTINNTGTIFLNSVANLTDLRLGTGTVTLQGGGSIIMSNNVNNRIYGLSGQDVLVNVNNTISGAGQIGAAQMNFVNQSAGVVDANQTASLTLDANYGVTNTGLLEDTGTGGLVILNTAVNNAGGIIKATGSGSHVDLSGSVIEGGTLISTAGGVINDLSNSVLDGSEPGIGAVSNAGSLNIINGAVLTLDGVINNTGKIVLNSAGSTTEVRLGTQIVTLQGGGSVILTDNANNYVFGNSTIFQLNNVDNTISGAGQLGNGQMQLSNSGTINANGTNALVINCGSYNTTNNASGLMEATGTGGLVFVNGIFSNNGTLAASGGNVTLQSSVFNLNNLAGTLSGGTWQASNGGTLAIDGGTVSTIAANVILSGATSVFETGNGSTFAGIGTSLTSIASGGDLSLLSKAALTISASSLSDSGTVTLGAGTLTVKTLTVNASGLLTGNGTEKGAVTDNGMVTSIGGTLDITGNLSGKGVLQIDNSSVAEVDGKLTVKGITFQSGGTETLALAKPAGATSVISGFAKGDVIDLTKTSATALSYSGNTTSGVLTVKNGSTTVATFNFSGNYSQSSFALASDGGAGVKITETGAGANPPLAALSTPINPGDWAGRAFDVGGAVHESAASFAPREESFAIFHVHAGADAAFALFVPGSHGPF